VLPLGVLRVCRIETAVTLSTENVITIAPPVDIAAALVLPAGTVDVVPPLPLVAVTVLSMETTTAIHLVVAAMLVAAVETMLIASAALLVADVALPHQLARTPTFLLPAPNLLSGTIRLGRAT
jgi:hypothetical protein